METLQQMEERHTMGSTDVPYPAAIQQASPPGGNSGLDGATATIIPPAAVGLTDLPAELCDKILDHAGHLWEGIAARVCKTLCAVVLMRHSRQQRQQQQREAGRKEPGCAASLLQQDGRRGEEEGKEAPKADKRWGLPPLKPLSVVQSVALVEWARGQGCPWNAQLFAWAAWAGKMEVIRHLHRTGCAWNSRAPAYAAAGGHLEVLKYLHAAGCPFDEYAAIFAARKGVLPVLQFLWERRRIPWNDDAYLCDVTHVPQQLQRRGGPQETGRTEGAAAEEEEEKRRTTQAAGPSGHPAPSPASPCASSPAYSFTYALPSLQAETIWAQKVAACAKSRKAIVRAMIEAAFNGHLPALDFLWTCGGGRVICTDVLCTDVIDAAASRGNLAIVEYLYTHQCPCSMVNTCNAAIVGGHIHVLEYLRSKGIAWTWGAYDLAVETGHVDVVRFMHQHGSTPYMSHVMKAIAKGDARMLRELLGAGGTRPHASAAVEAARRGDLEVLRVLRESGTPCGQTVCDAASANGHSHVVEYLHAEGCLCAHV